MIPRVSRWLLPGQSLAFALVLAWPAPCRLWTEAIGTPGGDVAKHIWNLWWARAELQDGAPGMLTRLVNWPAGMRLYPIEPLHAVLAWLLPLPPVALSNVLALAQLFILGLCAGWLGSLVTGTRRGALATAALAQGSSFVAFTLHVGVGELREVWWIPLGLGCLVRAQHTLSPRWFLALAATMAAATLSCFYHGLFLATAVCLHALASLKADRRLLSGYLGAAALTVAVAAPVIHSFAASYGPAAADPHGGFFAWMQPPFAVETYPGSSLDLPDLVRSRATDRVGAERLVYAYTGGRYIGVVALALALAGVVAAPRRAWPWALMALCATVLAMGTVVWWYGTVLSLPIVLPMLWINRALAWVAEPLNFPVRFLAVTGMAVAVLGGLAVTRWRLAAWLVPVALVDVAWSDLVPWPRDTTALPFGTPVDAPPGAVADFSVMLEGNGRKPSFATAEGALLPSWITVDLRTRGIAAQINLNRPFQTVPIERQEMWALDGLLWTAALPLAERVLTETVTDDDLDGSIRLLRDRGFGSVALTHACDEALDPYLARTLDETIGPHLSGGCFDLWPLPSMPATPTHIAQWEREQAERVAALPPPILRAASRERSRP